MLYSEYSEFLGENFHNILKEMVGEVSEESTALQMFKIVIQTPDLLQQLNQAVESARATKLNALRIFEGVY